jgi:hypothetical protein
VTRDACITGWAEQIDALATDQIIANAVRLVAAGVTAATVDELTASARLRYRVWRGETLLPRLRASFRDRPTGR